MLNFVTGRPTLPLYYHLIPNHISALGESSIVEGLNSQKPQYIILNNSKYDVYNKQEMCNDFGLEICKFINENYSIQESMTQKDNKNKIYKATIYKLKLKNMPIYDD